jgi:hypothetical protein|mmetsp:Transcript_49181/g.80898  ORF Transcript_49181/g.80898 Transcript_49181/m.80898 type:complete len:97 (+) Transcript_49181:871-1161(+)
MVASSGACTALPLLQQTGDAKDTTTHHIAPFLSFRVPSLFFYNTRTSISDLGCGMPCLIGFVFLEQSCSLKQHKEALCMTPLNPPTEPASLQQLTS